MIMEGFESDVAEGIISIPISITGASDKLGWFHTASGVYSVKSGYWVARELMEDEAFERKGRGATSTKSLFGQLWKSI